MNRDGLKRGAWLGLPVAAVVIAAALADAPFKPAELAAFDAAFFREGGPRLGRAAALDDVLLVELDERAALSLDHPPDAADDLIVYQRLLADGATFVGDLRDIDSSEQTALLEGMVKLDAPWKLVRSLSVDGTTAAKFIPSLGHHVINFKDITNARGPLRIAPLLLGSPQGLEESMPLLAARARLGAGPPTNVIAAARESGILAAWQANLPGDARLAGALAPGPSAHRPYPLGPMAVRWEPMPTVLDFVPPAGVWIDYGTPLSDIARVPWLDILQGRMKAGAAKGKVVFVQDTVLSPERHEVPSLLIRHADGGEVVAAAYGTIVRGREIHGLPLALQMLLLAIAALVASTLSTVLAPLRATGAVVVLILAWILAAMIVFRTSASFVDVAVTPATMVLAATLAGADRRRRDERARRRITDLFGRYVPREVVADLLKKSDAETIAVGGVKRTITVLFADVRGFTTWSDALPPERVLEELNGLLAIMVRCAFAHGGTVDKFIGDAILLLFNAPNDQPDHAERAVRAAWDMQQALVGHPSGLAFGIGVHSGEAVVGTIGTSERMEYTAIGAAVNLTSRLCTTALRGQIVISDAIKPKIETAFVTEERAPIRVKGIARDLTTFLVVGKR